MAVATPKDDTDELIRRAGRGDASAVNVLFERHRGRLAQMVNSRMDPRVRARVDPSDVVQETLAAASKKMPSYLAHQPIPFYPWLRQIAWEKLVHLHDRHLRAAKRSVQREQHAYAALSDQSTLQLAEQLVGTVSSPSVAALRRELRQRVQQALAELSDDDREILLQRYLEQMSSKEIGAVLGISEAAVNMRHMRALERMRSVLSTDNLETDR
jgi:RNA polymerase sigma-70 factor (ECF subfamily)